MSDVSYAGPLNQWLAQAPPQPPPRVMGKSLAELLAPYLGNAQPAPVQPNAAGKVPSPDFTVAPPGLRPRPSDEFVPNLGAAKGLAAGLVEPFGQLGRLMTGQSRDMPADILGAAMGLAPAGRTGKALKAGAEVAEGALKKGATGGLSDFITAYHGSPHDFDRFDLSKIGTGEGAQAYGHGLYFAENEGVAKGYREQLTKGNSTLKMPNGEAFDPSTLENINVRAATRKNGPDLDKTLARADDLIASKDLPEATKDMARRDRAKLQAIKDAGGFSENKGSMYQVAIKAPPEHFLDWDKPLSEQHPKVREAIDKFYGLPSEGAQKTMTGEDLARALHHNGTRESFAIKGEDGRYGPSGAKTKDEAIAAAGGDPSRVRIIHTPDPMVATEQMREAGIPGIKYLDQGSRGMQILSPKETVHGQWVVKQVPNGNVVYRGADEAAAREAYKSGSTHNFVVFDDKLIDILKKYGIAGIGALPAMNAFHYQENSK